MPEGPVIANNTPLVALWVLDRLELLHELYEEILIPQAVLAEFVAIEPVGRRDALHQATWIKPVALENAQRALAFTGLDQGEAEVLALAEERAARLVIIDERRGRRYAKRLGFAVTGTLGLLLLAKEEALISAVAPLVGELESAGLYLDPSLVSNVLELAGEAHE
jgi:hypothetical protein